jgi:hypothetical protein
MFLAYPDSPRQRAATLNGRDGQFTHFVNGTTTASFGPEL